MENKNNEIEKELFKMLFRDNPIPKIGGRDYMDTLNELIETGEVETENLKSEDENE